MTYDEEPTRRIDPVHTPPGANPQFGPSYPPPRPPLRSDRRRSDDYEEYYAGYPAYYPEEPARGKGGKGGGKDKDKRVIWIMAFALICLGGLLIGMLFVVGVGLNSTPKNPNAAPPPPPIQTASTPTVAPTSDMTTPSGSPSIATPPPMAGWPVLRPGQRGAQVQALQLLLTAHNLPVETRGGYNAQTTNAVRLFQTQAHLPTTGIADGNVLARLVVTVHPGDNSVPVRAVQVLMRAHRIGVRVDSGYGNDMLKQVRQFQQESGLPATGVIDIPTWQALFG
ncbi:MAG: peptidoglycan-binding protein [Mycobacteriales bacterium]